MLQLLEKERNELKDLLQATSDIIEEFKGRRSILAFDLYPITVVTGSSGGKWYNVPGFWIGIVVRGEKAKDKVEKDLLEFLRARSGDRVHDPTWWDKYHLRWHFSTSEVFNTYTTTTDFRVGVELRLKGDW